VAARIPALDLPDAVVELDLLDGVAALSKAISRTSSTVRRLAAAPGSAAIESPRITMQGSRRMAEHLVNRME